MCRALQILNSGIIPGNRNADNIDEKLKASSFLLFLSRTIRTTGVRAALLKSFGFGQVGGEVLLIHPDYIFTALSLSQYKAYTKRREERHKKTFRYLHDMLIGARSLVQIKDAPPYSAELESQVYLNPMARATYDTITDRYSFVAEDIAKAEIEGLSDKLCVNKLVGNGAVKGVGVDVQLISELSMDMDFLERNFTLAEREYCQRQADAKASYTGRWAAKEAIIKALCNANSGRRPVWLRGAGTPLDCIEILPDATNDSPSVTFSERVDMLSEQIKLSISHSGAYAIALAVVL